VRAVIEKELGARLMDDANTACAHDKDFALLGTCGVLVSDRLQVLIGGMVAAAAERAAAATALPWDRLCSSACDSRVAGRARTVSLFMLPLEDLCFRTSHATLACLPGVAIQQRGRGTGCTRRATAGTGAKTLPGGAYRAAAEKEIGQRLMNDDIAADVSDNDLALLETCGALASARLILLVRVMVRALRKLARATAHHLV
jgi:hypothetical protein